MLKLQSKVEDTVDCGLSIFAYLMGALAMSSVVNLNPQGLLKKWLAQAVDSVNPIISCKRMGNLTAQQLVVGANA